MFSKLTAHEQTSLMAVMFKAFDSLESTASFKNKAEQAVQTKLSQLKYKSGAKGQELNVKILDNLVERRAEVNRDLFKPFYLKYLTP